MFSKEFWEIAAPRQDVDMEALKIDQAYLKVDLQAFSKENVSLYGLSSDCVGCPYKRLLPQPPTSSTPNSSLYTLSTRHAWTLMVASSDQQFIYDTNSNSLSTPCPPSLHWLGQFGVYELVPHGKGVGGEGCALDTLQEPVFIYGGMIAVFFLLAIVAAFARMTPLVQQWIGQASCCTKQPPPPVIPLEKADTAAAAPTAHKPRLRALDTFRGITIVLMIFVNNGGGGYHVMGHAAWDGLLVADVVFPWFMWIMGVCIPMGIRSAEKKKVPKMKTTQRIVKRSAKLVAVGLILNSVGGLTNVRTYRLPGVLQRFGACYLVAALAALWLPSVEVGQRRFARQLADVTRQAWQWLLFGSLALAHTLIILLVPLQGCPTGYLGPGGLALSSNGSQHCSGGVTGWLDRALLGTHHLYQNAEITRSYQADPFDPEGVLGTLPSAVQVFLGAVCGAVLLHHPSPRGRLLRWAAWGGACGALGLALGLGGALHINKHLWSLSFVLVTSSLAFFTLAGVYLLVDVWGVWGGAPFYQCGMNSILLYIGHTICYNLAPWRLTLDLPTSHWALTARASWTTGLWVLLALYLHRKGRFYAL